MCKRCIGCGWKCRVGQEGAEERSKKGVLPMNLPWKLPKISRHSCLPPNTHHRGCVWGAEKRHTDKTFFQGLKRLSQSNGLPSWLNATNPRTPPISWSVCWTGCAVTSFAHASGWLKTQQDCYFMFLLFCCFGSSPIGCFSTTFQCQLAWVSTRNLVTGWGELHI